MINHGRTLLLNIDGSLAAGSSYFGEEYVPPSYKAIKLTNTLLTARNIFLGADTDRSTKNYRLRELLSLIHSTELEKYLLEFDPRITYWPFEDSELFNKLVTGYTVQLLDGATNWKLDVTGNPSTLKSTNQIANSWELELLTPTSVRITHRLAPFESTDSSFTYTNGISSNIQLPNTTIGFKLTQGSSTPTLPRWILETTIKPLLEVSDIYLAIGSSIDVGLDLFDDLSTAIELRKIWETNIMPVPYRLGAAVVAWMLQADKLRQAGV